MLLNNIIICVNSFNHFIWIIINCYRNLIQSRVSGVLINTDCLFLRAVIIREDCKRYIFISVCVHLLSVKNICNLADCWFNLTVVTYLNLSAFKNCRYCDNCIFCVIIYGSNIPCSVLRRHYSCMVNRNIRIVLILNFDNIKDIFARTDVTTYYSCINICCNKCVCTDYKVFIYCRTCQSFLIRVNTAIISIGNVCSVKSSICRYICKSNIFRNDYLISVFSCLNCRISFAFRWNSNLCNWSCIWFLVDV